VVSHVSVEILDQESETPLQFLGLAADLKSIPLWPRFPSSFKQRLVSANDALMSTDRGLLVPWMKDCHLFVDQQFSTTPRNRGCLTKLGVKKLSVKELFTKHVLPLPAAISDSNWEHFINLIAGISDAGLLTLHSSPAMPETKIAVDGKRTVTEVSSLYDHDNEIFAAAFRLQAETRFLHKSVQSYRSFWLTAGLCHQMDAKYYIQCLQVLSLRLSANNIMDTTLEEDSQTVLSLLTSNPVSRMSGWGNQQWLAISQEKVFQSRTVVENEPQYRQNFMASMAATKQLLCLSEVISPSHVAVCWSQTSFALHQPTIEVLRNILNRGQPKVKMVWGHLLHMKEIAQHLKQDQVDDFLADLQKTYQYLEVNLEVSKRNFRFRDSAIWLNLNTWDPNTVLLDHLNSSWHSIGDLVLSSSCDGRRVKAVRSGLMRYEKLLRTLGCQSIYYPTVKRPELHIGRSVSKSLRQLRNDGKLLDITYSTQGKQIQAHRVVLAAISEKCAAQFSGPWKVEDLIKYDQDDNADDFLSYHTLSTMINYAYEDDIDWKEMEVSDSDDADSKATKLNLLLDLAKGADYWLIPALKSQVEDKILAAGKELINLENVMEIRKRAAQARAIAVEEYSVEFIDTNKEVV
jgi:sacsin